jgi:hypothetical protein
MWTCDSDLNLRRRCLLLTGLLLLSGLVFFMLQNLRLFPGGDIAASKVFWLGTAIYFWFVIPALVLSDRRIGPGVRRIYHWFLINMLARAVIELYMMYVTINWHPHYGLVHDVFSVGLLAVLLRRANAEGTLDIWMKLNAVVMSVLFVVEFFFAMYMLKAVKSDAIVYYVPQSSEHALVLNLTWLVVILAGLYAAVFLRVWLYGPTYYQHKMRA